MKTYRAIYTIEAESESEAQDKLSEIEIDVLVDSMIIEEVEEEKETPTKLKVRDIADELNLFGIPYSWKENSLKDFLEFNGYKIIDKDEEYCDCEYEDIKAYLDLGVERL